VFRVKPAASVVGESSKLSRGKPDAVDTINVEHE